MERIGFKVDVDRLAEMQKQAESDKEKLERNFREWVQLYAVDARHMNIHSVAQRQQLFFGPYEDTLPAERIFVVQKTPTTRIRGFGVAPLETTPSGRPTANAAVLSSLIRDVDGEKHTSILAKAFLARGESPSYIDLAYSRISGLAEMTAIETLLHHFIISLPQLCDKNQRVHGSLNVNTETGRLSCRRPNLQNQPALEKDRYKIRAAFVAEKGCKLIVADYGQLELRILAHVSQCKSMLDAFEAGGDFHSRTAMGMYPHVARAVEQGKVLLEHGEGGNEDNSVPLLKDVFASERRKAKTLNFSIAYGKTSHGLAKDWGVSVHEATETLESWYRDRPEVREWQRKQHDTLRNAGYVETLTGRKRYMRGHMMNAAINTPIQGGAADVVVAAMVKVCEDDLLRDLGWKLILQVHDELILEGPEDSAEQALSQLFHIMQNPFDDGVRLLVDLVVDGSIGNSWFECK
eukprot:TRINITY_DN2624_c0_g1_i1.p1 TRINITY_DN2624_c0_g1~~TRINITY_DN2624_c0_g1_i1.p1  ORF type:complete len:463 (-),score=86.68 TRINITY_DN2624_c0_g1_i1:36-1424(-)